jgi:hypothetical protein
MIDLISVVESMSIQVRLGGKEMIRGKESKHSSVTCNTHRRREKPNDYLIAPG